MKVNKALLSVLAGRATSMDDDRLRAEVGGREGDLYLISDWNTLLSAYRDTLRQLFDSFRDRRSR